jgi:alkaline phosphatase
MDEAVNVAKNYAQLNTNTLLIVTGDHETGGLHLSELSTGKSDEEGPFEFPEDGTFYVNWTTTGHTSVNVPVTSIGPSSHLLSGTFENTEIHNIISDHLKIP